MCSHDRGWVSVTVPFLNIEAAYRVGIIACPNLWHVTEHAEVKAVSTGRARFKEYVREFFGKRFEYPVQSEYIPVQESALIFRRKMR